MNVEVKEKAIEIEKVVKVTEVHKTFQITLSDDEAAALRAIMGAIEGDHSSPIRLLSNDLYHKLGQANEKKYRTEINTITKNMVIHGYRTNVYRKDAK